MADRDPVPAPAATPPSVVVKSNATIPRESLERVLARAMELQSRYEDVPDVVSEERLMDIARDVGIDVANLRQAMAEEKARIPLSEEDHGALLDALGPGSVSSQRTVPGNPAQIVNKLDSWMTRMELLIPRRRIGEHITWEPRRDFFSGLLRSFGVSGRRLDLVRADQVAAMVTAIDEHRSVVRLEADLHHIRRTQRTVFTAVSGAMVAGFFLAAIPVLLLASPGIVPWAIVATIGGVLAGAGTLLWRGLRRSYRKLAGRVQLRLEQLQDELERGALSPRDDGLLGKVKIAMLGE